MQALVRFPAEWEKHESTWIAWPYHEADWPGNFAPIPNVYVEIVRALSSSERVEIVAHSEELRLKAHQLLQDAGVQENYHFHIIPNDRSWLRDSAPTAVIRNGVPTWIAWKFNAWAKYDNYKLDDNLPEEISKITKIPLIHALRPDTKAGLVLEGGAIETDGEGTLLTTEECLLSEIQERNPGLEKKDYELAFGEYLGISKTLWLPLGYEDDDTHGHIDDVARFIAPGKVLLTFDEENTTSENHRRSKENLRYLETQKDAAGRSLQIIKLPLPNPVLYGEELLPASYANFYIANKLVLLPIFNDPKDEIAIALLIKLFPGRKIVPINCRDLVLGCGAFHCLTQQQACIS